jgi:cytochrome c peroxidase
MALGLVLWLAWPAPVETQGRRGRGERGGATVPPAALAPLPEAAAAPADNPTTPAKVALGRLLFWDPVLSGHRDVACASCHHPQFGYAENRDVSIGVNGVGLGSARHFANGQAGMLVKRNSQTILNAAFNGITTDGRYAPAAAPMFWDVRVQSLEAQALEPIKTLEEMRGEAYPADRALAEVTRRLDAIPEYRELFANAFGGGRPVNPTNLGRAIAAFERSLVGGDSPFDRYMRGDRAAMTDLQIRGMARFEQIGCSNCHNGPMFSDFQTHVLGIPDNPRLSAPDAGVDEGFAFRTASLRNVALTAPYMHSGVLTTLDRVIEFYDDGRRRPQNANVSRQQLDPLLRRLDNPGRGRRDLLAFLGALTDERFDRTIPERVPSGLTPGGRIQGN